jgi:hypothetical protein
MKNPSPSTTRPAATTCSRFTCCCVNKVPEREREDDRGDEERLDHGQLPDVERDRLEDVAGEQRQRAEQPPCLLRQPDERARLAERDLAHPERALLLERRRQREQAGRDEREDVRHDSGAYAVSESAQSCRATPSQPAADSGC